MSAAPSIHADRLSPVSLSQSSDLAARIVSRLRELGHAFLTCGNEQVGAELISLSCAVSELNTSHMERDLLSDDNVLKRDYCTMSAVFGGMKPFRHIPAEPMR